MDHLLSNIRIVLVNTSHPGNIGGVARAMKNMELVNLYLVAPKLFPHEDAMARSSGAANILDQAIVVSDLSSALAGCQLVMATSARNRHIPWPMMNPSEAAQQALHEASQQQVAIVFGREDRGLTNEELHQCHAHIHIPTNPDFSSLNLAAAVQVITYELRAQLVVQQNTPEDVNTFWGTQWDIEHATHDELQRLFVHLEQTLVDVDFLDPENPRQLMTRLRRLFLRGRLDKIEVNVLRGFLTAINNSLKKQDKAT